MRAFSTFASAAVLALAASAANAESFTLDLGGGDGSVTDVTSPGGIFNLAFVLIGSNTGSQNSIFTTYTAVAESDLLVTGEFAYLATDIDGPDLDDFGYVINNVFTQLSSNDGEASQAGEFAFSVAVGDVFGWYINATDDQLGPAVATVGANLAPVPVPASLPLLGAAVSGLLALRRRRA